jgi:hypothetical protein
MARHGLFAVVCAGMVLGAPGLLLLAAPGDEVKDRITTKIEVQKALEVGLGHLQVGKYADAVKVLESKIHLIDGNREYLRALRDAYIGRISQLSGDSHAKDGKIIRERLAILDPAYRCEQPKPAPPPAAVAPVATTAPATPAGLVTRGKIDEPDPFAEGNSVAAHKARALIAQADQAYAEKKYESANRLYAQANETMPAATAAYRERWAYCKLYVVGQTINREGSEVTGAADLEREVKQAQKMTPKVEAFGNKLLVELRERAVGAKIEVRHTPRKGAGWALAETTNFRIFHAQSAEQAERVARAAETARATMARKWLGEKLPVWSPRCDVYLHPTMTDYARATGKPEWSPGHSTLKLEGGRVVVRRIDLRWDDKHMLEATLVHETTHVVLAGNFGRHHVPRWADEGMAVLSEPRERINRHLRNLPGHRRDGQLFNVGQLLRMEDYPEARRIGPFYAQSVSLVEFLVARKDAPTFTRFVRDGLDGGYEGALRKHYGLASFAELEQQWRDHAFGARMASVVEKR